MIDVSSCNEICLAVVRDKFPTALILKTFKLEMSRADKFLELSTLNSSKSFVAETSIMSPPELSSVTDPREFAIMSVFSI